MTRRTKTLLIGTGAFVFMVILVLGTAYSQGVDPLHPRTRHIWALSLLGALYVSVRGAIFIERMIHRRSQTDGPTHPGLPNRSFLRREHAIDRRMAERRARVAAAAEKQKNDTTEPEETKND